jgi:hypothetical protein
MPHYYPFQNTVDGQCTLSNSGTEAAIKMLFSAFKSHIQGLYEYIVGKKISNVIEGEEVDGFWKLSNFEGKGVFFFQV